LKLLNDEECVKLGS